MSTREQLVRDELRRRQMQPGGLTALAEEFFGVDVDRCLAIIDGVAMGTKEVDFMMSALHLENRESCRSVIEAPLRAALERLGDAYEEAVRARICAQNPSIEESDGWAAACESIHQRRVELGSA
jgi:hypothetical protein